MAWLTKLTTLYLLNFVSSFFYVDETCTPFTETCGPITPSPPHSYVTHVEVVDLIYNTTHYIKEFYDEYRQLAAVNDRGYWGETHSILYYNINTAVIIETLLDKEGSCNTQCYVQEISRDLPFMAAYTRNETSAYILSPSQALLFGDDFKYSYVEEVVQRGIPCNQWDACIVTPNNSSFFVEYQWSDPNKLLELYYYTNERPVMMKLKGQIPHHQGSMQPIQIHSTFNYGFFDKYPDWNEHTWAFEIPSNIYCDNLPEVKQPPTRVADAFSMKVEITSQMSFEKDQQFVSTVEQWYDYYRELARYDFIPAEGYPEAAIAGPNEVAVIQDFRAGVEYIIDKALGNCTTIRIPENSFDVVVDPNGKVSIKNPLLLFGLGLTNLTYYGKKYARDLPCDVWVGHLDFELDNNTFTDHYVYELFFLESDWREDGGTVDPFMTRTPELILVKIQQDITLNAYPLADAVVLIEENIFKYEEKAPDMTIYDITPCFVGHDHIRRFQIAFPGEFREDYMKHPLEFTTQVHDSLAQDIQIPLIRIQHTLIEFSEVDGNLYAEFTLVDRPEVDGIDFPESVGPPLAEVVNLLQQQMSYLPIILYNPDYDTPGHVKIMIAYPDSLHEMFESSCTPMISLSPPPSKDLSEEQSVNVRSRLPLLHQERSRKQNMNEVPYLSLDIEHSEEQNVNVKPQLSLHGDHPEKQSMNSMTHVSLQEEHSGEQNRNIKTPLSNQQHDDTEQERDNHNIVLQENMNKNLNSKSVYEQNVEVLYQKESNKIPSLENAQEQIEQSQIKYTSDSMKVQIENGKSEAGQDVIEDLVFEKADDFDDSVFDDPEIYKKDTDEKTYSPGAMAGMGIGMLILGILIGILAMLGSMKKLSIPERIELSSIIRK